MTGGCLPLSWSLDPLQVLQRWPLNHRVLFLHSGRFNPRWGRWSVMASPEATYRFEGEQGSERSQWYGDPSYRPNRPFTDDPLADLRTILAQKDGIWIGHLSYDLGRWIEKLPNHAVDDRRWPVLEFGFCPGYLIYDGANRTWYAGGSWRSEPPDLDVVPHDPSFVVSRLRSNYTRRGYEHAVATVKEHIQAGDVFQVNLAQRFSTHLTSKEPLVSRRLFANLATVSPAWHGAYLELEGQAGLRRAIASTSPELFLRVNRDGTVTTRPIKGTRPSDVDPQQLRDSPKDTAELNMIVDLLRNDLGRVCDYGTIRVVEPRGIETHPTVHHGVATITGRLHASKDVVDLLRATMPGGSITGAPKVRAMQIIDELEPVRRGPYCGAIGYLTSDTASFNIAIRTMCFEWSKQNPSPARVDFSVGGGIVADSDPASEYEETLTKAQAMIRALQYDQALEIKA